MLDENISIRAESSKKAALSSGLSVPTREEASINTSPAENHWRYDLMVATR